MSSNPQSLSRDRGGDLQPWMQQAGFSSFRALCQAAGISEKTLRQIRRGNLATIRVATLVKLSQVLQISVVELMTLVVGKGAIAEKPADKGIENSGDRRAIAELTLLRQEYDRLQSQVSHQRESLWQEFQQSTVQVLESLLLQLPTAAYAAQQNPQAAAVKLLPLLKPLDRLLESWGMVAIAPVGAEIPYDPQAHQLINLTPCV